MDNLKPISYYVIRKFLSNRSRTGKIIFCGITGSPLYNLEDNAQFQNLNPLCANQDEADNFIDKNQEKLQHVEFLGVYAAPTSRWFGFNEPRDTHQQELTLESNPSAEQFRVKVFEVKKVAILLLHGNATIMDTLFIPEQNYSHSEQTPSDRIMRWFYWTNEYSDLRSKRQQVLTLNYYIKYLGQAQAYFPKTPKSKPNKRNPLRDVLRLLYEAKRLTEGLDPQVIVTNQEERESIMSIGANAETSSPEIMKSIRELLDYLDSKRDQMKTRLPMNVEQKLLEDWLFSIRVQMLATEDQQMSGRWETII